MKDDSLLLDLIIITAMVGPFLAIAGGCLYNLHIKNLHEKKSAQIIQKYDINSDKRLNKEEFFTYLHSEHISGRCGRTGEERQKMFRDFDVNASGYLDKKELEYFVDFIEFFGIKSIHSK